MKRRDGIILAVVLLAALLCLVGRLVFGPRFSQGTTPLLRITVSGKLHSETPLNQQGEIVLQQPDGARNIVRYFPGGFEMGESSCPNQDCIHQGAVTCDNVQTRPLMNQIICLPNRVVLEMVNAGESRLLEVAP